MQREDIEITIQADGKIAYTIKGVKGSSCDSISALLEQLGEIEREEKTGEYYGLDEESHVATSTY